jgi:hypothetical protein
MWFFLYFIIKMKIRVIQERYAPVFMSHICGTFRPMIAPGKRGQYACDSIITPERTEPHQPSELDSTLDETTLDPTATVKWCLPSIARRWHRNIELVFVSPLFDTTTSLLT